MNTMMIALAFTSVMLLLGMLLRANVPLFRKMLVPTSVLAGIVGFILLNLNLKIFDGLSSATFTTIVNELFTLSFISIGLTSVGKKSEKKGKTAKEIAQGSLGMGTIWCILYALQPLLGALVIVLIGSFFGMNPIYGLLIPFGFAQGPGQAATFGGLFEEYGFENAAMVGLSFAVIGFLMAFFVGVILVKLAMKRGIIKSQKSDVTVERGYYKEPNENEVIGYETTHSGNIETLAFHFAIMGLCYLIAIGISKLFSYLPSFLGSSMSGMMFMNGMLAAYLVKAVMKKLKLDGMIENTLQSKITGFLTDFVVACSFMAVRIGVIGSVIVPILVVSAVGTVATVAICLYFGSRIGGKNDFERTLGLYGTSTGTVPSGIALVRMVNPKLTGTTAIELGMMNITMMLSAPVYLLILACASKTVSFSLTLVGLFVLTIVYIVCMKLFRCWGKPTYHWFDRKKEVE